MLVSHTTEDYRTMTQGGLRFLVPRGSKVIYRSWSHGGVIGSQWEVDPSVFDRDSIERHDATYYGVSVPEEIVDRP